MLCKLASSVNVPVAYSLSTDSDLAGECESIAQRVEQFNLWLIGSGKENWGVQVT